MMLTTGCGQVHSIAPLSCQPELITKSRDADTGAPPGRATLTSIAYAPGESRERSKVTAYPSIGCDPSMVVTLRFAAGSRHLDEIALNASLVTPIWSSTRRSNVGPSERCTTRTVRSTVSPCPTPYVSQ